MFLVGNELNTKNKKSLAKMVQVVFICRDVLNIWICIVESNKWILLLLPHVRYIYDKNILSANVG